MVVSCTVFEIKRDVGRNTTIFHDDIMPTGWTTAAASSTLEEFKSGRVHLAEDSNVVVLELPYSMEFERESRKFARGSENMENLMTVVDRLDELQASSV